MSFYDQHFFCGPWTLPQAKGLKFTCTILLSMTVRRSHNGGMQPCCTRNLICSAVPPELAFVIAHAASLRVLNSALDCKKIGWGKIGCFDRDLPGCLSRLGKCWHQWRLGFAVGCPRWCLRWSSMPCHHISETRNNFSSTIQVNDSRHMSKIQDRSLRFHGKCSAYLFPYRLLGSWEELEQAGQSSTVDDHLKKKI